VAGGSSECHANYFVVAESFAGAKARAKALPEFKSRRMHVDSLTRVDVVDGHAVRLALEGDLQGETRVVFKNGFARGGPE